MSSLIKKYWFLIGLVAITAGTLIDGTGFVSGIGKWCKLNYGPEVSIFLIFLLSGLMLDAARIRSGLTDYAGIAVAMGLIFLAAPLFGALAGMLPLDDGIRIGLFLVAVMPTTLSSGVVMTRVAGGNMAHALVITVLSNGLCVITIPVTLSLLLGKTGPAASISIDQAAIMTKLFFLVIVPLGMGLVMKLRGRHFHLLLDRVATGLSLANQCLILVLIWMAVSQARSAILDSGHMAGMILAVSVLFHAAMLGAAWFFTKIFRIGRGRRESIYFMGGQKTLTLSIILQVSLFPEYGIALGVCVIHHIVHLLMDSWLVEKLRPPHNKKPAGPA